MSQYRHWSNTATDAETIRYTYDGPEAVADGDDAAIALVAERAQTGPTTYHEHIEWHVRLYLDGGCVHDFAESHPDEMPAQTKEAARRFASRWARIHPRPLAAVGVTTPPVRGDTTPTTPDAQPTNTN